MVGSGAGAGDVESECDGEVDEFGVGKEVRCSLRYRTLQWYR